MLESLLQANVTLAPLTSFRVGGVARWYAEPTRADEVIRLLQWARDEALPVTFLGAGSNLLISDYGLPGLVLGSRLAKGARFDDGSGQVTVIAGEPIPRLAWAAARRGWRGLEWSVGIPGSLGGAVVMNAGAQGGCLADSLVQVTVLGPSGPEVWEAERLAYSYRHSRLQQGDYWVIEGTLQLQPGHDAKQVLADTTRNLRQRKGTQPYHLPNCGSVFRNPEPRKAGQLIESLGLKGHRIGQAQVAEKHANFILNLGDARATDILALIRHVQARVQDTYGVQLEPEVKLLGEFPTA